MPKCNSCGSEDVHYDSARGENACARCGKVLEENAIVSELAFNNSNVVGKFGAQSGDYTQIKCLMGYTRNSKEARLQKVYKQIQQLASNLNLHKYHADAAKRLFDLAHHYNFTQGRHTSHVIAAALYIVCRQEKTPHLLIDFSDALQINLYVLGACYLKFVKLLHLELPLVDPSLFIHRFCAKLEFGDKAQQVTITALRLLQRMKRDWMSYGRRPNSLCGAAILIAARYHGFKRTTNQIVQTVHVCDETIRKRLEEFKRTSVASLTREEFETIDLENDLKEELDPPSFKRALQSKDYARITNFENELRIEADRIENGLHDSDEEEGAESEISKERKKSNSDTDIDADSSKDDKSVVIMTKTFVKPNNKYFEEKKDAENLSEEEDNEIQQFLLTPEESHIKTVIWNHIHKEWLDEQNLKKESLTEKKNSTKKRKKKPREIIDAPDPITALTLSSKLGSRLNQDALPNLFEASILKRVKKE